MKPQICIYVSSRLFYIFTFWASCLFFLGTESKSWLSREKQWRCHRSRCRACLAPRCPRSCNANVHARLSWEKSAYWIGALTVGFFIFFHHIHLEKRNKGSSIWIDHDIVVLEVNVPTSRTKAACIVLWEDLKDPGTSHFSVDFASARSTGELYINQDWQLSEYDLGHLPGWWQQRLIGQWLG